uniref:Uncharacterized protein n=1 Tax=Opuntia streptacantha TaxID=393608 RepID=A0A7C8YPB4_OPUST
MFITKCRSSNLLDTQKSEFLFSFFSLFFPFSLPKILNFQSKIRKFQVNKGYPDDPNQSTKLGSLKTLRGLRENLTDKIVTENASNKCQQTTISKLCKRTARSNLTSMQADFLQNPEDMFVFD